MNSFKSACLVPALLLFQANLSSAQKIKPDAGNAGLKLPESFGAVTFAKDLGKARHLVADPSGTVYVKLQKLKNGKGIVMLRDTDGDGKADQTKFYGDYNGTGAAIWNNYLYLSSDTSVYRYPLPKGKEELDEKKKETVVTKLPVARGHSAKSITISPEGKLYVNIGAPSNSCQENDRQNGSKGMDPCPLLDEHAGVWEFDASRTNQRPSREARFSTGLRNCVALEWDTHSKNLFAVPHGRDQFTMFPEHYTEEMSAELPSEEFFMLEKGGDYGWPYCYYDHLQNKKLLNPEYGGDGKKTDRCEDKKKPLLAFPGHLAPNDLLFYHGSQFPEKYKHGAFIAFHGSWNRAPLRQAGYFVAFVPFKDGKPAGKWEVFAEGFTGLKEVENPDDAKHRPMGLAEGPDGSLYISDSVNGTIWKIIYTGNK